MNSSPPRLRIAGISGRELGLALLVAAALLLPLLASRLFNPNPPLDLTVYRLAGLKVLRGADLYARGAHDLALQRELGWAFLVDHPFTYPPFAALAAVPLAILPARAATVLWTVISLLLLAGVTAVAFRPLLAGLTRRRWLALGLLAGVLGWTVPVADTLGYGQVNLVILALCVADCLGTPPRRGLRVGIATAVKLVPGLFIVYFLISRQTKAAVRALAGFLVCTGVAAMLLPKASLEFWSVSVFSAERVGGVVYFSNQSLYGAIVRLGAPAWLWAPFAAAVILAGLWGARRAHAGGEERIAVALVGLASLLVSPISWQHHAVWIIVVAAALAGHGERRRLILAGATVGLFLLRLPMWGYWLYRAHPSALSSVIESVDVWVYLGLMVLLLRLPEMRGAPRRIPADA